MCSEIRLSEILKSEIGMTFYSPCVGSVKLTEVDNNHINCSFIDSEDCEASIQFLPNGSLFIDGNCMLFPSKYSFEDHPTDARAAWAHWLSGKYINATFNSWQKTISDNTEKMMVSRVVSEPENACRAERGAFAVLAMFMLIKCCYGGVVSYEDRRNGEAYFVDFDPDGNPYVVKGCECIDPVAFRTKEWAERFIDNPDAVKLLKDFYMAW